MRNGTRKYVVSWIGRHPALTTSAAYASRVHARVTRGPRLGPPIAGCARTMRKNRIASGGLVAAAHSDNQRMTGLPVAASMNEHRCHAETVNVIAANDVYLRSERERSSTLAPIARISSAASSAETAWTAIALSVPGVWCARERVPVREVAGRARPRRRGGTAWHGAAVGRPRGGPGGGRCGAS